MDREKLAKELKRIVSDFKDLTPWEDICKGISDYILDNFVSKEEVLNEKTSTVSLPIEDYKRLKEIEEKWNDYISVKAQANRLAEVSRDSKPRECSNCGWRIGKNCGNGANACLNHNQWTPIDKPRECERVLDEKPGLYDIYMTINDLIDYLAERGI